MYDYFGMQKLGFSVLNSYFSNSHKPLSQSSWNEVIDFIAFCEGIVDTFLVLELKDFLEHDICKKNNFIPYALEMVFSNVSKLDYLNVMKIAFSAKAFTWTKKKESIALAIVAYSLIDNIHKHDHFMVEVMRNLTLVFPSNVSSDNECMKILSDLHNGTKVSFVSEDLGV